MPRQHLQKEKKEHGFCSDGTGNRYKIGPHYTLLGDDEGALAAFEWFEKEFSDDAGEPGHLLCWSLALHRAGNEVSAAKMLRQTMLSCSPSADLGPNRVMNQDPMERPAPSRAALPSQTATRKVVHTRVITRLLMESVAS